eukprot:1536479-Pleurochrysis_carterae.AAC.8
MPTRFIFNGTVGITFWLTAMLIAFIIADYISQYLFAYLKDVLLRYAKPRTCGARALRAAVPSASRGLATPTLPASAHRVRGQLPCSSEKTPNCNLLGCKSDHARLELCTTHNG